MRAALSKVIGDSSSPSEIPTAAAPALDESPPHPPTSPFRALLSKADNFAAAARARAASLSHEAKELAGSGAIALRMSLPVLSSKNFGVSIEFMVARDASAAPASPPPFTPRLLDTMLSYLEANAMSTRDLFLQRGDALEVQALVRALDASGVSDNLDIQSLCTDSHVVATALKIWLVQLPEPLLTNAMYLKFVEAEECGDAAAAEIAALFSGGGLPRAHLHSVHDLINFLHRFSLNSSKHGVDARALALAFGPLILRSTSSSTRELLLLNVASAVTLCQRLVQQPELIGI